MATGRVDHVICAGARGWDSAGDCDRRRKSKYAECLCCMCEASASPVVNSGVQSFLCVLLQAHDTNMSTRTCAVASACIPTHLLYTTGAMSNRAHTQYTNYSLETTPASVNEVENDEMQSACSNAPPEKPRQASIRNLTSNKTQQQQTNNQTTLETANNTNYTDTETASKSVKKRQNASMASRESSWELFNIRT